MTSASIPSRRPAWGLVLAVCTLAAGCAGQPDRFYTLSDPAALRTAPAAATQAAPTTAIEVLPVGVPERLARPQMVVRTSAASPEVQVLEQHRWSASFEKELRDALSSGIATRLGAIDASKTPTAAGLRPWRIAVQVARFDAVEGERVDGAFTWTLHRAGTAQQLDCRLDTSVAAGAGMGALARASGEVAARLAKTIADAIASADAATGDGKVLRCPAPGHVS
ncbi:membrane integrity-associated transporter subunit PqiC [Sphingomonas sp. NCPPB 2930]